MRKSHSHMDMLGALGIVLLMLSACTQAVPNSESSDLPDGYTQQQLTFPASDAEENDFNKSIFDITPFSIQVEFPDGWYIGEFNSQEEAYLYSGVWSRIGIYDEDNECLGAVGYNTFETDENTSDEPMSIYNQIALGNDYQFNVKNSYTVVNETSVSETATVDVYYSPSFSNSSSETAPNTNYGILSYNRDKSVYVAFEFENTSVSDEVITYIANSISFAH